MKNENKFLKNKKFIFILSKGRSGSTWFSKELSLLLNGLNLGENRFFWEKFGRVKSTEKKNKMFNDFFRKEIAKTQKTIIIEKSTNLYLYLNELKELSVEKYFIILIRDEEERSISRKNFASNIFKPKRIIKRIRKLYKSYGFSFLFSLFSKLRLVLNSKGSFLERLLVTNPNEVILFNEIINSTNNDNQVVQINYDNFKKDILKLEEIGLDFESIEVLKRKFRSN